MGFSWSSAVAQDVMLAQTAAVGLDDRYLLADGKAAPNLAEVDECFAVCTDDVMHWACDRLARLDVQLGKAGITWRPNKDIDVCTDE